MQHADLVNVMDIEQAVHGWPWTLGNYEDCLSGPDHAWVALAPNGELLGYYVQTIVLDEAHLLTIAVAPGVQRQGLGKVLLEHALAQAKLRRCQSMLLELRRSNLGAMQLYQTMGFVLVGCRKNYYRADLQQREDALLMRLELSSQGNESCG